MTTMRKMDKIVIEGITYNAVADDGHAYKCSGVCSLYDRCIDQDIKPCEIFPYAVHFVKETDKKVYVSLPISNVPQYRIDEMLFRAQKHIGASGHKMISPYDASPDANASYSTHMGNDIKALLECDMVLMMPGWQLSKGCQLEHSAAKIYDKLIIYYER